jgi:hypothetical protein
MARTLRTPSLTLLAALGGTLLAGCESAPTQSATSTVALRAAPSATADKTSNIVQFAFPYVFGIFDEETQLLAVLGLPADATQWEGCGGTLPGELFSFKAAGAKSGVFKVLGKDADVAIQVFRTTGQSEDSFGDFNITPFVCVTEPIAVGTGRVRLTDNDGAGTGGGNNVINISLIGTLTDVATGGLVRLTATHQFMQDLSTGQFTLKRLDGRVNLHPVGGQ